jgi:hypothetical protein|tara:strand:+ start:51 stop:281 length:231 start_codon:yes stop_codon:yes gene_type:complete
MSKLTYLWSDGMIDTIAKKVAEEPMENVDEGNYEYLPKRPQHIIDEEKVDEEILERHDRRQMEMFDDPDMNWSGQR